MELFETQKNFIIINGSIALFCDRLSGHLSFGEADKLNYEWNPVCLGQVKGLLGKVKFFPDGDSRLILITELKKVGELPCIGDIFKITKVATIPLNTQPLINLEIDLCKNHHFGIKKTERIHTSPDGHKPLLRSFHDQVKKTAESVKPKSMLWNSDSSTLTTNSAGTSNNSSTFSFSSNTQSIHKDTRDRDKFEKRMLEEYEKMFQEGSDNFYIANPNDVVPQTGSSSNKVQLSSQQHGDITSNIQRQRKPPYNSREMLWRRADDRFFYNKYMLKEAIDSAEQLLVQKYGKSVFMNDEEAKDDRWLMIHQLEQMLMPIIQGYVDVEPFQLQVPSLSPVRKHTNVPNLPPSGAMHDYPIKISLISRRNRYRAGTRYRRRGVDENGNVANYIETEQILRVENDKSPHIVSFVQVRGSVPVFWTQTSLKYRPPIILEKSDEDNQDAFEKHLNQELEDYDRVIAVNLVDTTPDKAEKKIAFAFLERLIKMNSSKVTCIMFDFHDYCKGLQFDNVTILINGVTEIFRDMKYTWVDKNGLICEQKEIFRVNCVDCLDRTNVVQCMLAGVVVEIQMRKLGLLSPEESLPTEFYQILQTMWANNGDAISRQYSGTAAMKGDYTRTGTRTMNGLMKDGVSSVNRYYLRLREMNRQAAIDLMVGNDHSSEVVCLRSGRSDTEQKLMKKKEENIKELTAQCRKACLKSTEDGLTEFILIMGNENEREFQDMNTVVLVTTQMLYFVSNLLLLPFNRVDYLKNRQPTAIAFPLKIVKKIQLGMDNNLFRSAQPMLRIFYEVPKLSSQLSPREIRRKVQSTTLPTSTAPSQVAQENDLIPPNPDDPPYQPNEPLDLANNTTGSLVVDPASTAGKTMLLSSGEHTGTISFVAFKQPGFRLFNNMLIEVKKQEDQWESLKAIAESLYHAVKSINHSVDYEELLKLDKLRTEPVPAELQIPININMLYENVSVLEDEDDDGEQPPSEDEESRPAPPGPTTGGIESIKQGLRNVKDKVRLREWRDKFTVSVRNTPLIKLRKLNDPNSDQKTTTADMIGSNSALNKSDHEQNGSELEGKNNTSMKMSSGNDSKLMSRLRIGSVSDDESQHTRHKKSDQQISTSVTESNKNSLNVPTERALNKSESEKQLSKIQSSLLINDNQIMNSSINKNASLKVNQSLSSLNKSDLSVNVELEYSANQHAPILKHSNPNIQETLKTSTLISNSKAISTGQLLEIGPNKDIDKTPESNKETLPTCGIIMCAAKPVSPASSKKSPLDSPRSDSLATRLFRSKRDKNDIKNQRIRKRTQMTVMLASDDEEEGDQDEEEEEEPESRMSLSALTSGVFQKRAEKISLQLSVDEAHIMGQMAASFPPGGTSSEEDSKDDENYFFSTNTSGSMKSNPSSNKLSGSQKDKSSLTTDHAKNSVPSETLIETTAAPAPARSQFHIEAAHNQQPKSPKQQPPIRRQTGIVKPSQTNYNSYITVPPVEIRNPKTTERLVTKQMELVQSVEALRREIHGDNNCTLNTKMILF